MPRVLDGPSLTKMNSYIYQEYISETICSQTEPREMQQNNDPNQRSKPATKRCPQKTFAFWSDPVNNLTANSPAILQYLKHFAELNQFAGPEFHMTVVLVSASTATG